MAKTIAAAIVEIGKVAAAIVAIIGVGTAIFTLYFLFWPNQIAWTSFRANLSEPQLEHNATVEDFSQGGYLNSSRPSENADLAVLDTPSEFDPQTVGNVVTYKLEAEGFATRTVRVYWSVYRDSGERVDDPNLVNQFGWPSNSFQARRRIDVVTGDAFVPLPQEDGEYFVKLAAWDGEGVRLDVENTEEFEIVGGRSQKVEPETQSGG